MDSKRMHPRNRYYKNKPDFYELAEHRPSLKPYLIHKQSAGPSQYPYTLDFSNPLGLRYTTVASSSWLFSLVAPSVLIKQLCLLSVELCTKMYLRANISMSQGVDLCSIVQRLWAESRYSQGAAGAHGASETELHSLDGGPFGRRQGEVAPRRECARN